jgi:anaplastic lymphoma kinase
MKLNYDYYISFRALGQGAFGEVYQGFYKKSATDSVELSVAVKTLPELSSNQVRSFIFLDSIFY